MAIASMRDLLEAGIHFGHQTRRWNPKMKRYIYGQRNGIYIVDLTKTMKQLVKAYNLVRNTTANGGSVLFVGTKKQAQEPIIREAERSGQYYVVSRWLGGTLTNWETIRRSIRTLSRLEEMEQNGTLDKYSKKEGSQLRKQKAKLDKNLCGIKAMGNPPNLMFVIDTRREHIAVREAERIGIPCIGITDTNCDPDAVSLPIPGNDDAIRAINLFCKVVADAAIEGRSIADKRKADERQKLQEELARRGGGKDEPAAAEEEPQEVEAAAVAADGDSNSADDDSRSE